MNAASVVSVSAVNSDMIIKTKHNRLLVVTSDGESRILD